MRIMRILVVIFTVLALAAYAQAQRRGGGTVTFAVMVTDTSGAPIGNVLVTVQGAVTRQARTERGRIAVEGLPAGAYKLKFEHPDFVTAERDITARGRAPIDVKVELTAAPKPEPPPKPVAPPPVKTDPVIVDITTLNVGRGPSKTAALACATGGSAELVQVREPLKEEPMSDADRFLYVIAGTGNVRIGTQDQPIAAGTFVMIPRGVSDELSVRGRNPVVLLAVKAGGSCAPSQAVLR
jgi:mannose-6-phosphate isomerase-like protein (cupin superfamily)